MNAVGEDDPPGEGQNIEDRDLSEGRSMERDALDRVAYSFTAPAPSPDGRPARREEIELPPSVTFASPGRRLGAYLLELVLFYVTLGIGWIIWAILISGEGETPAKRILGLRVISATSNRPLGVPRMFWMRWLIAGFVAAIATIFTLGIILFMPFWDDRNRNIWDRVSASYVVHDPSGVGRHAIPELR